jgi:hypothetical protein
MSTYATAKLVHAKKGNTGSNEGDPDLSFLEGKKIVGTGFVRGVKVEGGLAFDYQEGKTVKRVVLGFTDLGMWIEWHGVVGKDNPEDVLRRKVCAVWDSMCDQKVVIIDKPLERRFSFVGKKGKELLSLSVTELKMMGSGVREHFVRPALNKDVNKVISDIGLWAFN